MTPDPVDDAQKMNSRRILFFDGVCALCNSTVNILMKLDRSKTIRYAPLQGETAKARIPDLAGDKELKSLVYLPEGVEPLTRSDAVIEVLRDIGGICSLAAIARIVPRAIRDRIYDLVAANRYKIFGKLDSCRVPTAAERKMFLP